MRSVEKRTIKRQLNKKEETRESEWYWITSLSPLVAPTQTIELVDHGRWDIENYGFNAMRNLWHGDQGADTTPTPSSFEPS